LIFVVLLTKIYCGEAIVAITRVLISPSDRFWISINDTIDRPGLLVFEFANFLYAKLL